MARPLPIRFYERHTVEVARDLLGCEVLLRENGIVRRGRIVEAEAYRGFDDEACHGARGETPRLKSMFGPGGRALVYITYGIHHMLNAVTEEAGYPSGVLIRALEPLHNVNGDTRGPGLLTKAMGIALRHDGSHLRTGAVRILEGGPRANEKVAVSTRVGVEYSGPEASAYPWRFFLSGNAYVSRGRPTDPVRSARLVAEREASRAARRKSRTGKRSES